MSRHDGDPSAGSREQLSADLMDPMSGGFTGMPTSYALRFFFGPMFVVVGMLLMISVLVPSRPVATTGTVIAGIILGLFVMSIGIAVLWTPCAWNTRRFLRFVRTVNAWLGPAATRLNLS